MANDINSQDPRGRTALHHAIINKQPDVAKQLLKNGADPNIKDNQGRKGLTPLWYACCSQSADPLSVQVLKDAGAKADDQMVTEVKRQLDAKSLDKNTRAIAFQFGLK